MQNIKILSRPPPVDSRDPRQFPVHEGHGIEGRGSPGILHGTLLGCKVHFNEGGRSDRLRDDFHLCLTNKTWWGGGGTGSPTKFAPPPPPSPPSMLKSLRHHLWERVQSVGGQWVGMEVLKDLVCEFLKDPLGDP